MKQKIKWYKSIMEDYGDEYIETTCPFLVDERCSIYEKRPSCCKNYPHTNGYCQDTFCMITQENKNSIASTKICSECNSKCCKRILIPLKAKDLSDEFFYKWLDISCENCNILFSELYMDRLQK